MYLQAANLCSCTSENIIFSYELLSTPLSDFFLFFFFTQIPPFSTFLIGG